MKTGEPVESLSLLTKIVLLMRKFSNSNDGLVKFGFLSSNAVTSFLTFSLLGVGWTY